MLEMHQPIWRGKLPYVACYGLLALVLAASIGVFFIWTETILALLAAFVGQGTATPLVYGVAILVIGVPLFIWALFGESYLRRGVPRHQGWVRFIRLMLPLTIAAAVGLGLQLVAAWAVR